MYPHSQVVGSGVSCVWECIGEPPHQFNMRLGVSDPGFLPVPGEEKFVVIRGDHDAQTDEFIYNNGEENLSCSLVLQIQGDSLKLVSSSGHVNQTVAIITEFSRTVYDANPTLMCQEQDESRNAFIFPGEFTFSCTFLDDLIQAAVSDRHVNTASPKGTAFGTCYIRLGAETFQPVVRL